METTQEERDQIRAEVCKPIPNLSLMRLTAKAVCNDADRLAQYERYLHDDIGKDRSQDTDWLRAGFLQRGAEIERLEDGIRALAHRREQEASNLDERAGAHCRGYQDALYSVVDDLRALLDEEGQ